MNTQNDSQEILCTTESGTRKKSVRSVEGMFVVPIMPLVVRLSLPIAAGMFFQLIYNVVDAIFISLIDRADPSYFGATGLIFPFIFLAIAVANGFMVGTSSMVARAIGEDNHAVLDTSAESGVFFAGTLGILFIIVSYLFDEKIIVLLGAQGDFAVHALEYLQYIIPGVFIMFVGNTLFGILQGEGSMRYMMWGMIIGTVGNIILDPVCIFLLDMKVRGAALATVIAQAVSLVFIISVFARNKTRVPISWHIRNVRVHVIKEIVAIGLPQTVSQIFMALTFLIYNRIIISIDELALTAFSLYGRFEQLLFIPVFAINSSLITIIGQNAGRGNYERGERAWRTAMRIGLALVILLAGLFVLASPLIFGSLSDVEHVVGYAVGMTRVPAFSMFFAVGGAYGRGVFQAIGHPIPALIITMLRMLVLGIPAVLLFVYVFHVGVYGVWFGIVTGNGIAAVISYGMTRNAVNDLRSGRLAASRT